MTIDYRIRSPSPVSVLSAISDTSDEIDTETESVELVTISSPVRHPSHLLRYEKSEPIIITPKPLLVPALTYEPHSVVHRTPIYQVVERTPSKAVILREMTPPAKMVVDKKPPYKWSVPVIGIPTVIISLLFFFFVVVSANRPLGSIS